MTNRGILTPRLRAAARELKENDDIVIRKADKGAIYVILDKDAYIKKIDEVLSDRSKFKPISRNPTDSLKTKINKIIDAANAKVGDVHFSKITGGTGPDICTAM